MVREGEVFFDVAYPEHLSRGLIFIKWLLIIPHIIVLWVLSVVASVVYVIGWFAVLILGRYPVGMWNFATMVLRWGMRVNVYTSLMRDEYPPFGDASYPIRFDVLYPQRLSRWKIFFKWLFVIPHMIALYVLGIIFSIVSVIAWFAILITGRYPQALFDFSVGVLRWGLRVSMYLFCLTDVYPPFSLR
ncbi:MAG TPA: DUF4389 domain-containing protein [Thermomicrobiales bacterium]|nr:DUF4389 domain-containing protein [Thermomicrobiales bacterium]